MSSSSYYTVHVVFHSAQNLPVADLTTFSCDPYIEATVVVPSYKDQSPREPADPPLTWRTPTVRRSRNPTWDAHWLFSAVPAEGFFLEMRVRDEDQKKDDRLGMAVVLFDSGMMHEGFEVKEKAYKVKKRRGSFRPWLQTYLAAAFPGQKLEKHNRVVISARVVAKSTNEKGRKPYTIGPNAYTEHFSPLLGHFIHHGDKSLLPEQSSSIGSSKKKRVSASSFSAIKLQLSGPAPPEFRCHYVGYNTFIKWLYSNSGVMGHLLNHGLRKQYRTVYSYDKNTKYGIVQNEGEYASEPSKADSNLNLLLEGKADDNDDDDDDNSKLNTALARTFLSLTRFGADARLYTYVLTLDAEWRFSETGDEFAIDFLSKHMMHADGAPVVMISGEFFVRKMADYEQHDETHREKGEANGDVKGSATDTKGKAEANGDSEHPPEKSQHKPDTLDSKKDEPEPEPDADADPSHYELIIDNDSGTYRPPKTLLPAFQAWLGAPHRLGALGRVTAMDGFDEKLTQMKEERKAEKKRLVAGGKLPKRRVGVRRGSGVSSFESESSMSSGEVEDVLAEAERRNEVQTEKEREGKGKESERASTSNAPS